MIPRLLFFEGPPGGGKSSLSQFAVQQLQAAGVAAAWVEEHTLNEAVFASFFDALDGDPAAAIGTLLACWQALLADVQARPDVVCLDGAFFHSTLKLLLAHTYDEARVAEYLRSLYALLEPAGPPLVHLTGDVERIVRDTIADRGAQWTEKVADDVAQYACQRRRQERGAEGLVRFFVESQRQLDAVAAAYPFAYHRIDTTARDWPQYQREVCALLGVPLQVEQPARPVDLAQYAGTYHPPAFFPPAFNHPLEVELCADGLRLHMVFLRNFRLVPQGPDRFAIVGRPHTVEFVRDAEGVIQGVIYPFVPDQRFLCERRA